MILQLLDMPQQVTAATIIMILMRYIKGTPLMGFLLISAISPAW